MHYHYNAIVSHLCLNNFIHYFQKKGEEPQKMLRAGKTSHEHWAQVKQSL